MFLNDATDVWQIGVKGDNKWKKFLGFLNLRFEQIVSGNSGGLQELIIYQINGVALIDKVANIL